MARSWRRRCAGALHLLVALSLALSVAAGATPAATLNFAGVVVRHADGQFAYGYVGFAEQQIKGIELLKRTGLDVVTVAFGGLGEGVCAIDEHGCPATECRKRLCQGPRADDPFWQYFRQALPGDWQPLALGASQTRVQNGDLDGWSWTHDEAGLPALTLEEVAARAGFDGTAFAGRAAGEPGAVYRREGFTLSGDDTQGPAVYLAATVLMVLALAAVGFVVLRRRRGMRESP